MNEILAILLSERPLFITSEGYRQMVMAVLPYMKPSDAAELPKVKSFFLESPTYKEECDKAVVKLQQLIKANDSMKAIEITNDFENQEPPSDTIAYHRVKGFIREFQFCGITALKADIANALCLGILLAQRLII